MVWRDYRRAVPARVFLSPAAADAVLAAAVGAAAWSELLGGQTSGALAAGLPLALLMAAPLAVRRAYPLGCVLVVAASFLINWLAGIGMYNYLATVVAGLVAAYTATAHLAPRRAWPALAVLYGAIALAALRGPTGLLWGAILVGGAGLAGFGMRERRLHAEQLAEVAQELALSRDENARSAVAAERARIARELHDVVAHAVSVMVVQAGAAGEVLTAAPDQARAPLESIQVTGRQALVELRRLLGVLRTDERAPQLAPQPGLADVAALAQRVREAGVPVQLAVEGRRNGVPPGLDVAAYRIVQEALTNVLKHAEATRADVAIRYRDDAIELTVRDDGHGPTASDGSGHGLVGMRERVLLYGGRFDAGPQPGGGFAVRARLPVSTP